MHKKEYIQAQIFNLILTEFFYVWFIPSTNDYFISRNFIGIRCKNYAMRDLILAQQ